MPKKVTIDVLAERIDGLREFFEEKIDTTISANKEAHDKIIEQTTKTNGSVRELQKWRSYILGALSVLTVLVLPILIMIIRIKVENNY